MRTIILALLAGAFMAASAAPVPPLVPLPISAKRGTGGVPLTKTSHIIISHGALYPLAKAFSEEIAAVTGLQLKVLAGQPRGGDIALTIASTLKGEQYKISCDAYYWQRPGGQLRLPGPAWRPGRPVWGGGGGRVFGPGVSW
jgi:hypothetical protein